MKPGQIIALRYRIIDVLGRGGMGTVYLAEHTAIKRRVALKLLSPSFDDPTLEQRFAREALTAARLDHPGCVRLYDHGRTVDGRLYLTMEHCDGPTLAQMLQRHGALAAAHAGRIALELLAALAYAHEQGVLHRDLKAENVMLARRGEGTRVVLIDFGLARLRDDVAITSAGTCMGSPSYVAPERLAGAPADERSDLYSLGVLMHEMLTGRKPFGDGEPMEIAMRQMTDPPPPIDRDDVPAALVAVVMRALVKDPRGRYGSAAEMARAVEAALAAPAPKPRPRAMTEVVRATPPPPPPARRHTPTRPLDLARAQTVPAEAAAGGTPTAPPTGGPRGLGAAQTEVARAVTAAEAAWASLAPPAGAPNESAIRTLALHMSSGPLWKRLVAWWRHGAWRLRLPTAP